MSLCWWQQWSKNGVEKNERKGVYHPTVGQVPRCVGHMLRLSLVAKSMAFGLDRPGFEFWVCHSFAVMASYLNSMSIRTSLVVHRLRLWASTAGSVGLIPGQGTKIPTNLAVQPKTKSFTMLCGSLDGRVVWGRMDTCICMPESLCCPPETITTLLTAILQYKIKS